MFCVIWEFLELLQDCEGGRSFRETKNHPAVGSGLRSAKSAAVERTVGDTTGRERFDEDLVTRTKPGEVILELGYSTGIRSERDTVPTCQNTGTSTARSTAPGEEC